jgi:Dolichyl-phosphate-mannose-protein mannosyltransferase
MRVLQVDIVVPVRNEEHDLAPSIRRLVGYLRDGCSFDSSNFITVDKTPASLWVMELSGRMFGFSQWSMLAPQALEGVGSVLLLYAAVRRWFGPAAGLVAGLVLALTPVAAAPRPSRPGWRPTSRS